MVGDNGADYLAGLPAGQRAELERVNLPGLAALRGYLKSGEAVAFLGAGASAPLYPLWAGLIGELLDAAASRLTPAQVATCRALAGSAPEEVVEILRRSLGSPAAYHAALREVLRARTGPDSGRSWTAVHELVCRCAFKAVVTTNYDPGIVDARMRVRPGASATGFTTWQDELGLDEWRTGRVFGGMELPVLYAHGVHSQPDSMVLAASDYRRAYAGKLAAVLARLADGGHLCWIGFSFTDQRLAAIVREVPLLSGTRDAPGAAPGHVAIMAWDPDGEGNDPGILAQRAEISYGAQIILYPAAGGDHSALAALLAGLTDTRFSPAAALPARAVSTAAPPGPDAAASQLPVAATWVPAPEPIPHFTGRAEELARLDRWAADPGVRLIGVTAWGGAGKTALITHWIQEGGAAKRTGLRGVFGWSFYADPSAEHWAAALLEWAQDDLGAGVTGAGRLAAAVLALLRAVPVLLVLDGLEVAQEGPAGDGFGRLLDGTLREVLAGACLLDHSGLIVLTSRFPFADLEAFDGGAARMLDVPPFTSAEGAALLAAAGGGWLPETGRRDLVAAVDGHALAVGVLAGLLADHLPTSDLEALRASLAGAARTDTRVRRVLEFYAGRLAEPDRYLLAAVSLFARPVPAGAVLAVAGHEAFGGRLAGWTEARVQAAVRDRLGGLATCHPDETISAHPLVRDAFRPLALPAASTAASTALTGIPGGRVTNRADALRVVEAVELLLDAGHWKPASDLYLRRADTDPSVWRTLLAARMGQRASTAFVATPGRRRDCATQLGRRALGFHLNEAGLRAMHAGDVATARYYLPLAVRHYRDTADTTSLAIGLQNLANCLGRLGQLGPARDTAAEALTHAEATSDRQQICDAHACLGWLAGLAGETAEAEQQFTAADQIEVTDDPAGDHLYSGRGVQWAEWLARTGRPSPAQALTTRNAAISRENGWNENLAWCDRLLGRLALNAGDITDAGEHLAAAVTCLRNGDHLTELAETLPGLAGHAQAAGDLDAADRHLAEAISIAAPRGLVLAHAAALAARARLRAAQASTTGSPDLIAQGRDAADAALRLATRHHLPWPELDALRAHAALDEAEGAGHGWTAKAGALHARLAPPGLDPDPLATVEQLIAARRKGTRKS